MAANQKSSKTGPEDLLQHLHSALNPQDFGTDLNVTT